MSGGYFCCKGGDYAFARHAHTAAVLGDFHCFFWRFWCYWCNTRSRDGCGRLEYVISELYIEDSFRVVCRFDCHFSSVKSIVIA